MMWLLPSALWLMAGCSVIDDDLSDCPTDEAQYQMEYELKLVTNMTTELQTQLTTITELSVASALETHLENIFSDFAHDVNLSFYDTEGVKERLEHKVDIINTNQTTYDLTLPMRKYLHLAVANIAENNVVGLFDDEHSPTSKLQQAEGTVSSGSSHSIVDSHTTGLFTARQPMEVLSGVSQTFNVRLYMANSAATLVLDPKGHTFKDIRVYATGFANEFHISDSTYVFPATSPLIKADKVATDNDLLCYCTVNFPSPDAVPASVFYERPLRYDEASGKVYFGDNEAFTVISASDDEITIVKPGGIRGGDNSKIYLYIKLRRMSAEELKECQDHYWINGDDIDRTITEEDIFHKWVVTQCPGLIINREGDRSNDRHYIRFMPDGTVEGKYDNTHFKGTYTCELVHTDTPSFRGEENSLKIQITPDADGGQWPGCFKDFDQGLTGYIIYGSHLTITIPPDDFTWQFVRGYDE